jgi:hypothetical protein
VIELSLSGELRLQCDVCRKPVTDAGLAIVMRGPGAAAVFVHKTPCHRAAERFLCRGTAGWLELHDFLADLRVAVGADDQADELNAENGRNGSEGRRDGASDF